MHQMLARHQLDACIAVVPLEKIPQVGIQLLERRMPCSVEKPLGASLADVHGLYDSARATGTPNMVSVNRRFMPFLNRALDRCDMCAARSPGMHAANRNSFGGRACTRSMRSVTLRARFQTQPYER
jgi:hypothetical protein